MMRRGVVVVVVLMGVCLSACQSDPVVSPSVVVSPSPSRSVSPSPSVSASPSFSAELQPIYQGLMKYLTTVDRLAADPMKPWDEINAVATGDEVAALLRLRSSLQERNRKYGGSSEYKQVRIEAPTTVNGVTQAVTTYCVDLARFQMLDLETGQVIENPNRPKAQRETTTMELLPDGIWRAAHVTNKAVASC